MLNSKPALLAVCAVGLGLLAVGRWLLLSMDSEEARRLPPPLDVVAEAALSTGSALPREEVRAELALAPEDGVHREEPAAVELPMRPPFAVIHRQPSALSGEADHGSGSPHSSAKELLLELERVREELKARTLERDKLARELDYCRYPETDPYGSFLRLPDAERISEVDKRWLKNLLEGNLRVCLAPGEAEWIVSLQWEKGHYKQYVRYFGRDKVLSTFSPAEIEELREDEEWFQDVFGPYPNDVRQ